MGLKRAIRRTAAATVSTLGLGPAIARVAGGRAAILAYHRVVDPARVDPAAVEPGMFVTRDTFAAHVELLARRFRVVPLAELVRARLTAEPLAWGTVVITFDDGWRDTGEVAFPLLRDAGLPATVFVPSALIGTGHTFWFSRAAAATAALWRHRVELRRAFPEGGIPARADFVMKLLADDPPRERYIATVLETCKTLDETDRDAVLDFVESLAPDPPARDSDLLTWDELRAMRGTFEIGSHTVNHLILTQLDEAGVEFELAESKRQIAAALGEPPTAFCYPNGNHDERIMRLVARAGYAAAVTTSAGFADAPADLFALPRLGVHQGVAPDAAGLELLLSGLL